MELTKEEQEIIRLIRKLDALELVETLVQQLELEQSWASDADD